MSFLKTSTLILKLPGKNLELPLKPFVFGIKKVKSVLLECHPDKEDIIMRMFKSILISTLLLAKRKNCVIVESLRPNKWMILTDKKIFLDRNSLLTSWLQMSVQELIGKGKVYKPFWTEQCKTEISPKLWLPIETDSVDSHSTFWNGSSIDLESHSWFSIKQKTNPEALNSQTTFSPSYMFIRAGEWDRDDTKTRKIRIAPTTQQKIMLKQWMGTRRYVYNKCLGKIKTGEEKINALNLRDKYITRKRDGCINPEINEWEFETPSDIREGAIRDLVKNYKSAFSLLRNRQVQGFNMSFCCKKDAPSIEIPLSGISAEDLRIERSEQEMKKASLKIGKKTGKNVSTTKKQVRISRKEGGFYVYSSYLKSKIRIKNRNLRKQIVIDNDCRIKVENNVWYLIAPFKVKNNDNPVKSVRNDSCSLDPGVTTFQTVYSEQKVVQFKIDKELVSKYLLKLDLLASLRAKKILKHKKGSRRIRKKMDDLINDLHHKTANYLTNNYNTIILPPFESQEMVKKSKNSDLNRNMLQLRHFCFRQRLSSKCRERKCNLIVHTEEYTSQTCGVCGELNDVKGLRVYHCRVCGLRVDRDVNGARNVMIKYINSC